MVRAISHVLAALFHNASDFKRRWNQDPPPPAAAAGLQRRWEGEWISEANGHRGALRCLLAQSEAGDYQATFHATYAKILRVCYSVRLRGQWSDGKLDMEGEADLGRLAGGNYHYQGMADEKEFICLYKCKYDHGTFRLKPARPESPKMSLHRPTQTMVRIAVLVLACGLLAFLVTRFRTPEASFQGRTASSWLRGLVDAQGGATDTLEAFGKMGGSADPVLLAALKEREGRFARLYRGSYDSLPSVIQHCLPQPEDGSLLRQAAVVVLQHSASSPIFPQLYPLLKTPDSGLRLGVLQALRNQAPDADQIPWLLLAGNDPDGDVRSEVWDRLGRAGSAASNAVPALLQLCADSNLDARQHAAWTLWKVTGQTNTAIPVLEGVLSQTQDAESRHWAAYYLLIMGDSSPALVTNLIGSLASSEAGDRANACSFLGEIGPRAAAAIPALRQVLRDPEEQVRRRAEVALSRIEPPPGPAP